MLQVEQNTINYIDRSKYTNNIKIINDWSDQQDQYHQQKHTNT